MARKKQKRAKNIFIALGAIAILVTSANFILSRERKETTLKPIPFKAAQYSDKNITQNAIAADLRFKNLAFEKVSEQNVISDQFASVIKALIMFFKKPQAPRESGTWAWTPVSLMSNSYIESVVAETKKNEIDVIYLAVDSYLDIFVMPESAYRDSLEKDFSDKLQYFIKTANTSGIEVDAVAGWRNWAEEGHTYKPLAIATFIKKFNSLSEHKFRGLQYDIEPYLLPEYDKEPEKILKNFVTLIDETKEFLKDDELLFSIAIPEFYDEKDQMTPQFYYKGREDYVLKHLLSIMDDKEGSSIILMSYRNFAEGFNGSIEISKNEMKTAKRHSTRMIIAQETGEVLPDYITFYGTSKELLKAEAEKINEAFGSNSNFGGISLHYANSLFVLK